jgi:hypothetical protein
VGARKGKGRKNNKQMLMGEDNGGVACFVLDYANPRESR